MTDSKSTKRSLAASIGCIALCVVMLIGTTFAWFTDTATTGVNAIQSGTLKVSIVGEDGNDLNGDLTFKNSNGESKILWEPNASFKTQPFKVKNVGKLALQYKFTLNGVDGDSELLKAIEFSIVDKNGDEVSLDKFAGRLDATDNTSDVYYIKGHMLETAGNEYQDKTLTGISLAVSATQYTYESDSKDNMYDNDAEYATPVSNATDLKYLVKNGKNVVLENNITLDAIEVTSDVTIYGNGNKITTTDNSENARIITVNDNKDVTLTLSGVDIVGPTSGTYNRAISVYDNSNLTLVMDNCSVSADHYAMRIGSGNDNVNIVVRNTTITGYSAFETFSSGTNATFENCNLIGLNQWETGGKNVYGTIVVYPDASNSTLTFKNCSIESRMDDTSLQELLYLEGANSVATFENCTFFLTNKNGTTQLTTEDEILYHMGIDDKMTAKIIIK